MVDVRAFDTDFQRLKTDGEEMATRFTSLQAYMIAERLEDGEQTT